jgi:hypothetical protein
MLIQTIRRNTHVTNFCAVKDTVRISYIRIRPGITKSMHLIISPLEYLQELDRLAMIDGIKDGKAIMDDIEMPFDEFITEYPISQWEASQIAISHELGIEIEEDVDSLELDSALNALK